MKRDELLSTLVFAGLVTLGVWSRFAFLENWPNFTAAASVALFAGYFFASRVAAMMVPLAVMVISNLYLPSYNGPGEVFVVYGALIVPVLLGGSLRTRFTWPRGIGSMLASSLLFYVVTNLAAWFYLSGPDMMYDRTWAGLVESYVAALPFFRNSLAGNLVFFVLLFDGYFLAAGLGWLPRAYVRVPKR